MRFLAQHDRNQIHSTELDHIVTLECDDKPSAFRVQDLCTFGDRDSPRHFLASRRS